MTNTQTQPEISSVADDIDNIDKFSKKANSDLSKYEIKLVIITKYTPLIKKCGNVEIFSFDELRKYIKNI